MWWALPKQCDDGRVGPCPSNRKMRLFWDLIHIPNTSREVCARGGGVDIKKVKVYACLCQREKRNNSQVEGDKNTDVRAATAEGYKKMQRSQQWMMCVRMFVLLCVYLYVSVLTQIGSIWNSRILFICIHCASLCVVCMWTCAQNVYVGWCVP